MKACLAYEKCRFRKLFKEPSEFLKALEEMKQHCEGRLEVKSFFNHVHVEYWHGYKGWLTP